MASTAGPSSSAAANPSRDRGSPQTRRGSDSATRSRTPANGRECPAQQEPTPRPAAAATAAHTDDRTVSGPPDDPADGEDQHRPRRCPHPGDRAKRSATGQAAEQRAVEERAERREAQRDQQADRRRERREPAGIARGQHRDAPPPVRRTTIHPSPPESARSCSSWTQRVTRPGSKARPCSCAGAPGAPHNRRATRRTGTTASRRRPRRSRRTPPIPTGRVAPRGVRSSGDEHGPHDGAQGDDDPREPAVVLEELRDPDGEPEPHRPAGTRAARGTAVPGRSR